MEEYIELSLAAGHIRPSTSPAAAGFFFVGKKDGGPLAVHRLQGVEHCHHSVPPTAAVGALEQLRGARLFTKMDLRSAYNLVRIPEGDEPLSTRFSGGLLGRSVIAYIDDILVYSASMEEHVIQVREVLARLQQHHLYVKLEKCEFHRSQVTFLGYVILHQGVEMDTVKVQAVKGVARTFYGAGAAAFPGLRQLLPAVHTELQLSSRAPDVITQGEAQKTVLDGPGAPTAFLQLKDRFTTAPILRHPDPELPFVVEVDTSCSGIGAVLSQRRGEPRKNPSLCFSLKEIDGRGKEL
ncbi:hypothetical protein QTP70_002578 [Hemibagrus guttatus]|uniref:ribonuclease H n=1 Tax=Hemibagrus guttatus TaxID=175788 RepID=A0AAE0R6R4_9TELE|nr:hypothetical protein QTP70_002578 [Hemibagrus guttatus]